MTDKKINITHTVTDQPTESRILLDISVSPHLTGSTIKELERILWQVKETLNRRDHKQKTWDQKEESQEDQPEQESSIHNNDQKSQGREQRQKTERTNKKQYIVSYPVGKSECLVTGLLLHNCDIADTMLDHLTNGDNVIMPNKWKVQVIDL